MFKQARLPGVAAVAVIALVGAYLGLDIGSGGGVAGAAPSDGEFSDVGLFVPSPRSERFCGPSRSELDAVASRVMVRAWQLGAGPGTDPVVIDLDSTICEVHGKAKQGAAYGYTKRLGYHPLLATLAGTGEILTERLSGVIARGGALR